MLFMTQKFFLTFMDFCFSLFKDFFLSIVRFTAKMRSHYRDKCISLFNIKKNLHLLILSPILSILVLGKYFWPWEARERGLRDSQKSLDHTWRNVDIRMIFRAFPPRGKQSKPVSAPLNHSGRQPACKVPTLSALPCGAGSPRWRKSAGRTVMAVTRWISLSNSEGESYEVHWVTTCPNSAFISNKVNGLSSVCLYLISISQLVLNLEWGTGVLFISPIKPQWNIHRPIQIHVLYIFFICIISEILIQSPGFSFLGEETFLFITYS